MKALVSSYIAVRRAAGFKMDTIEWRLNLFAEFAEARHERLVRTETAIAWAGGARSPHSRHIRMRDLVRFATYLRAEDPAHEVPPRHVYPFNWSPRPPRIYSEEEVAALLTAISGLTPHGSSRPVTYQTLFALLAVTGMRVREALNLQIGDFTPDGLRIRETKFRKSRFLPLHATTHAALEAYRGRWRRLAGPADPLFVSLRGRSLNYSTVVKLFLLIVRDLGLRPAPGRPGEISPGPRIHGLRHTFAVRALEACPAERKTVNRHILALSTYMGHSTVGATVWYLHATPHLMCDIADACEALDGGGAQ